MDFHREITKIIVNNRQNEKCTITSVLVSNMVSSTNAGLEYGLEWLEVSSLEVSSKMVSSLGLESMVSSLGLESRRDS